MSAPQPCLLARAAAWAAVATLTACATPQADRGLAAVQQAVAPHLALSAHGLALPRDTPAWTAQQDRVDRLLLQPLDADTAVQVALLGNRGLQAQLAELRITEAEIEQAARLPNPGLSLARTTRGDEIEIERSLHLSLGRLLLRPWTQELEERRLQQVQALAAQQVLALAADTRRAWIHAVAAEERLKYAHQVMDAAQAGAELARRMATAGNFNALQTAREESFAAEATVQLARAQHARTATRERLSRLLGLWGEQTRFTLPTRLPPLPAQALDMPDLERQAMATRLDVQGARQMAERTARQLGLVRPLGLINVLELGAMRNSSNEAPMQRGWEVSLELPLFDWGQSRVARAEAVYWQALHQAAHTAVEARSELREAYGQYRTAWDIAHHQLTELVPLRQRISQENLLRYNGMLIGVFELLADARAQVASVTGALDALRDFWLAQVDLDAARVGKPALAPLASPSADAGTAPGAAPGH
jgi:outer membrane protein TolC